MTRLEYRTPQNEHGIWLVERDGKPLGTVHASRTGRIVFECFSGAELTWTELADIADYIRYEEEPSE